MSGNPIGYGIHTILHTISHVYDIVGSDYGILCNFICFLVPALAGSNAGRYGSKAAPNPPIRFR